MVFINPLEVKARLSSRDVVIYRATSLPEDCFNNEQAISISGYKNQKSDLQMPFDLDEMIRVLESKFRKLGS